MKKSDEQLHQNHIKILHKKINVIDKPNIRTLYEFCDCDPIKTQKILTVAQDIPNPYAIIKILKQRPQKAEQFLASLENRYDKEYRMLDSKGKKQSLAGNQLKINFFKHLPIDVCLTIFLYLDPYSLSHLSQTDKKMNKISGHNAISEYYRKICLILFPIGPPNVPNPCRFSQVQKYVLTHPTQFSPNTRNNVVNNLQYYVWKENPKALETNKQYFLKYGSYFNLFKECPRIHYNGYYVCKHRYVKEDEKQLLDKTNNSYIIQYFRYLRFFSDGSVLSEVSSHKITEEKLIQNLSLSNLENDKIEENPDILIGEFRQFQENVYVKTVKGNSLFNYHLVIKSNDGKISNQLVLMKYKLELIDQKEIVQVLEQNNEEKQSLSFHYKGCSAFRKQNEKHIKACSL